ncbi:polysaccharide pyruvyl transferase family protein [Olivibacter sp. SDN3]|uniref:polysaccharide pyruvyl transferase family protein n=1 Tax=Olivibacter sp. SDN3 TaxID=2764720 RepID=UPI0016511524|nr:polysaccharide pyruvyl transferase family protein [Olivibacter sp. SDN3]QNL51571.1 polysaccharide pyruvyl transferase family protein [Olivibacter sp. SDN3]
MNSIYFVPASQTENTGDLLINKVAIQLMGKYGQIILEDNNTDRWFIDELRGKQDRLLSEVTHASLDRHLLSKLARSIFSKNKVYLVLAPGHTSRQGKEGADRLRKRSTRLLLFKALGLRIVRVGFSIGPFDDVNMQAEAFHSKVYFFYGVRDKESVKMAIEGKFKKPQLFPDLAWSYEPPINVSPPDKDQYIILSFRSNSYGKVHDERYFQPYVERVKAILKSFSDLKLRVIISYQVKYDREASFVLQKALMEDFDVEVIDRKLLLEEAAGLYNKALFVISNRLHVLLFALQCNTISFPLIDPVDNKKIYHIWKDNQMAEAVMDINEKSERNVAIMQKGVADRRFVLDPFIKARQQNEQLIQKYLSAIFN